jgi:hypothetical protein
MSQGVIEQSVGGGLRRDVKFEAKILKCTCREQGKDPLETHSYVRGVLQPCPTGRVEYLGVLTELTKLIEKHGCSTVEEFKAKHPFRWGMYQVKQVWQHGNEPNVKLSFFNS